MNINNPPSVSNRSSSHPDRAFLTLAEFAELLGIGTTVAYELAQKNKLPVPVWRVGRQYRISRAAYERMQMAQHAEPAQSDDAA